MAISTTTASFERVSCLNKDPQVARVDDFKNCRRKKTKKITRDQTQLRDLEVNVQPKKKKVVISPDWNV